jgi:hypothetical protein
MRVSFRTKRINHKVKSCLVPKASTSDEELLVDETRPISSSSSSSSSTSSSLSHIGRTNEQPTHGILKAPSGEPYMSFH